MIRRPNAFLPSLAATLLLAFSVQAQDAPIDAEPATKPTPRAKAPAPASEPASVADPDPASVPDPDPVPDADPDPAAAPAPDAEPVRVVIEEVPSAEPSRAIIADPEPPTHKRMPSRCDAAAVQRVMRLAEGAAVSIEAPMSEGLGFLFHSKQHVVTTFSMVEAGRGIVVGQDRLEARVVAVDRERDLAILELERPLSGEPLIAGGKLRVGEPTIAIGRRWVDGADELVAQTGAVTSASGSDFTTDATHGPHAFLGAPILSCRGRVVGVATGWWDDRATSAAALDDLASRIGNQPEYTGGWSLWHPSVAFMGQIEHGQTEGYEGLHRGWLGVSVGTALIGHDRWYFPMRVGISALLEPEEIQEDPLVERRGLRAQVETGVGYRFLLSRGFLPLYLVPKIGGAYLYDRTVERTSTLLIETCSGGECTAQAGPAVETVTEMHRLLPTVGMAFQFGVGEVGYQLIVDPEELDRSVHQVSVGLQF